MGLSVTKHARQVTDPAALRAGLVEALDVAKDGQPRPTPLDVPKDVSSAAAVTQVEPAESVAAPGLPAREAIEAAAAKLRAARCPLVLARHGVVIADAAEELAGFAAKNNLPVATTLLGLTSFDEPHRPAWRSFPPEASSSTGSTRTAADEGFV